MVDPIAESALGPAPLVGAPRDPAALLADQRRWTLSFEQIAYLALFALALIAHLWGLGNRALHHDEIHHAHYSWLLYTGDGYVHDPLLHGPLLYYANALMYFLFGDNNFTARLAPALLSSFMVLVPYLMRREMGRSAALLAAAYLAISPVVLYVGRFIRHDTYAVMFELLAFVGLVRYVSTGRARWLYLVAAALGLMFVTMESFYLYAAIMAPLVLFLFLWQVWKPGLLVVGALAVAIVALVFVLPGEPIGAGADGSVQRANGAYICPSPGSTPPPDNPITAEPGPIFGWGALETEDNNYALCVRHQPDNSFGAYFIKLWQFFSHPALLSAIALTLAVPVALYLIIWRWQRKQDGTTIWQRARARSGSSLDAFASLGRDWRVLIALGIFVAIYGLFFSAFLTNPVGLLSGTTGSLLYWLAQHGVQRGNQPGYYYLLLLAVYEPLILCWSVIGVALTGGLVVRRLLARRSQPAGPITQLDWSLAMPVLLVWWSVATVAIYSWAGEKMPWLTLHPALPLTLLGAWALATALRWGLAARLPSPAAPTASTPADLPATNHDATQEAGETADLPSLPLVEPPNQAGETAEPPSLPAPSLRPLLLYLGMFALIAAFVVLVMIALTGPANAWQSFSPQVIWLGLAMIVVLTIGYGLLRGPREALGALALATTLVVGGYTVRSAYQLNFHWGDTPREVMVFVQTSPDVQRIFDRLEAASIKRSGRMDMVIWSDNETVWNWYTRNFTNGVRQSTTLAGAPGEDVVAVLMLQENIDAYPQNLDYLRSFRVQRFPLRWWFPENEYRLPDDWRTAPVSEGSPLLMRVLRMPFDSRTIVQTWQYLMYREPPAPLGSSDFVLAVRPVLADEIGLGLGAQAVR